METGNKQTIGQIVVNDYRTAQVFREFALDFCCGGDKTIEKAAENGNADPERVMRALTELSNEERSQDDYEDWSLDFLANYIAIAHHQFTRNKMQEIEAYAKKVGQAHPELIGIYGMISKLHLTLVAHQDKEEKVLFPYISELVDAADNDGQTKDEELSTAAEPVAMMEDEHEEAGKMMADIRKLSDDFAIPRDACATYQLLYENLEGFEKDLHKHVHLGNNIRLPKALELEQTICA